MLLNYLFGAWYIGAILLVYYDGVIDVVHDDILVGKVGSLQLSRRGLPCLDPQPIGGAIQGAIPNGQADDIGFVWVLTEAPNTNAMARATKHIRDV